MKKLFLTIVTLMAVNIYAQLDDPANQIGFEMTLADKSGSIGISANKLIKNEAELTLTIPARICGFDSGITLILGNGETIQNKNEQLTCEKTPGGKFRLSGKVFLDEALYKKVEQFDITEFRLGEKTVIVKYEGQENLKVLLTAIDQGQF